MLEDATFYDALKQILAEEIQENMQTDEVDDEKEKEEASEEEESGSSSQTLGSDSDSEETETNEELACANPVD